MDVTMITWPVAFAMVASVVTITVGIFTYLITAMRARRAQPIEERPSVHRELSGLKERVSVLEADVREHGVKVDRNTDDVKLLQEKADRLYDLLHRFIEVHYAAK